VSKKRKIYPASLCGRPLGKYHRRKYTTVTKIAPGISDRIVEEVNEIQPYARDGPSRNCQYKLAKKYRARMTLTMALQRKRMKYTLNAL
jgi:hypothetical protein